MDNLMEKIRYQSESMQHIRKELAPVIESATPILFWGEAGSGMGFYAAAIHEGSGRAGKFLRLPGFSIDDDAVKQQFLGSEDQPGWLEEADSGTIFIKRISEMSPAVQQMLTYLLGNQSADGHIQFSRKGATEVIEVNVRFIYSMTHNLNMAIQDELVRRDFLEEIKKRSKVIHLPALRERRADIRSLIQNFFEEFNSLYQQQISAIDGTAEDILLNYRWPGNIDELKRVIGEIFSHYPGITTITEEHLPDKIKKPEESSNKYSFKLKDDVKFIGEILSVYLKIQTDNNKVTVYFENIKEIVRIEDTTFAPAKFKHFLFKLKDGSQITGKILDKTIDVKTSFDKFYQVTTQDIQSVYTA